MDHIFPSIMNTLIVQATLSTAFAILAEAALYSQRYLANLKWWMSVGPGIAILTAVFGFNFLGDALRDAPDPRLRRSGT